MAGTPYIVTTPGSPGFNHDAYPFFTNLCPLVRLIFRGHQLFPFVFFPDDDGVLPSRSTEHRHFAIRSCHPLLVFQHLYRMVPRHWLGLHLVQCLFFSDGGWPLQSPALSPYYAVLNSHPLG